MRAAHAGLLATTLAFVAALLAAAATAGPDWMFANRAELLTASAGFGAAVAVHHYLRSQRAP
ncbi:MAG: hypothetical protein ABEJ88_05915 [Halobacterium sp.]